MSYLLDTNVVSQLDKQRPATAVLDWYASVPESALYLSVIVIGEIRKGADQIRPRDSERAARLDTWLERTVADFGPRLVPIDRTVAERWGRLNAQLAATPIAAADSLIAASALVHDWTVVTRNVQHFERTGVRLLNPFEAS